MIVVIMGLSAYSVQPYDLISINLRARNIIICVRGSTEEKCLSGYQIVILEMDSSIHPSRPWRTYRCIQMLCLTQKSIYGYCIRLSIEIKWFSLSVGGLDETVLLSTQNT